MVTWDGIGHSSGFCSKEDPQAKRQTPEDWFQIHLEAPLGWEPGRNRNLYQRLCHLSGSAPPHGQRTGPGRGSVRHLCKGKGQLFLTTVSRKSLSGIPLQTPRSTPLLSHLSSVLYYAKHGEASSRSLVLGVSQFTQLHMCR